MLIRACVLIRVIQSILMSIDVITEQLELQGVKNEMITNYTWRCDTKSRNLVMVLS